MQKIITFLGMNEGLTQYRYGAEVYEGRVFPQALRQFQAFDQMLVCLTDGARKRTWGLLDELNDDRIVAIDIPDGRTEEEIWITFERIVQHIDPGDRVIFDITHGLRSLPFQVFLFAAYLKAAKNATIEKVYYGAFDLKENGVAPVIDLSSFVSMLDWLTATDRFTATGDGQALAQLIRQSIPSEKAMRISPKEKRMGGHLEQAAIAIETISLALAVTRPQEVTDAAKDLNQVLTETAKSLAEKVKPFALVREQVETTYGQFEVTPSGDKRSLLLKQLELIEQYLKRQQIVQAVTLAREWIISVYCWKFDPKHINDRKIREDVAQSLNNLNNQLISANRRSGFDAQMGALPNRNQVNEIWQEMIDIRNDIAHCGMSHQRGHTGNLSAQALSDRAQDLMPRLTIEIAELLR